MGELSSHEGDHLTIHFRAWDAEYWKFRVVWIPHTVFTDGPVTAAVDTSVPAALIVPGLGVTPTLKGQIGQSTDE